MKFGEKVRAARLAAKYSQRQLADMTGIALRTIQNYESGERLPKQKENYQLLATALNVDVDALKDDDADFVIRRPRNTVRAAMPRQNVWLKRCLVFMLVVNLRKRIWMR